MQGTEGTPEPQTSEANKHKGGKVVFCFVFSLIYPKVKEWLLEWLGHPTLAKIKKGKEIFRLVKKNALVSH